MVLVKKQSIVSPPLSPGKLSNYLQQMSSTEYSKMALILGDKEINSPKICRLHLRFGCALLICSKCLLE
jgi:hypothetical protein